MNDEILTVEEAAQYLKVKAALMSQLLENGEVSGKKIGGEWRTTRRALASFIEGVPLGGNCCCVPVESEATGSYCGPVGGRCC